MATNFPSINAFQSYFDSNDTLELAPGQVLKVENAGIVLSDKTPQALSSRDVIRVFREIIYPLGKTLDITPGNAPFELKVSLISKEISISPASEKICIRAVRGPIETTMLSLFRTMLATSRLVFKLEPGQPLIILDPPLKAFRSCESNFDLLKSDNTLGCKASFALPESRDYTATRWSQLDSSTSRYVKLVFDGPFITTLVPGISFTSIQEFQERALVQESINEPLKIAEGSHLLIMDSELEHIKNTSEGKNFKVIEALNTLLSPMGLSVHFKEESLSFAQEGPVLLISGPLTLFFRKTDYVVIAQELAERMLKSGKRFIRVDESQKLIIPASREVLEEVMQIQVSGVDVINRAFKVLMRNKAPVGFHWNLYWEKLSISWNSDWRSQEHSYVTFKPSGILTLSLEPEAGVDTVLKLINGSHPGLKKELLEAEVRAFNLLLAKAFFLFSCLDLGVYPVPEFFQEEVREKLFSLQLDPKFMEALETVRSSAPLRKHLDSLLNRSPEEFEKIELRDLPEETARVLRTLLGLASEEMQGGVFIQDCTKRVITLLTIEEDLKGLSNELEPTTAE